MMMMMMMMMMIIIIIVIITLIFLTNKKPTLGITWEIENMYHVSSKLELRV